MKLNSRGFKTGNMVVMFFCSMQIPVFQLLQTAAVSSNGLEVPTDGSCFKHCFSCHLSAAFVCAMHVENMILIVIHATSAVRGGS